jgi:GTPase
MALTPSMPSNPDTNPTESRRTRSAANLLVDPVYAVAAVGLVANGTVKAQAGKMPLCETCA